MFGWSNFSTHEMTDKQTQALAGGIQLRLELTDQADQFKKNQKNSQALFKLFWNKANEKPLGLAFKIMANLGKVI